MKLSEILVKDNNNIDLFRLFAASMVIYGHAYALSPPQGKIDIVSMFTKTDYSGSLAVKIFFFLSGLVVTNSLVNNGNLIRYVIARVFRIFPALIATIFITALVIGPICTTMPIDDYFRSGDVRSYLINNSILNMVWPLPGVFTDNPYPNVVNGSLWTISIEIYGYIMLFSLYVLGALKNKKICNIIFLIILIEPFLSSKMLFPWLSSVNREVDFLAPCFAFGSLLALNKDLISIKFTHCLGFAALAYLLSGNEYSVYFLYACIFLLIIYISSMRWFLKLKPSADISYGVYLWGWPIQQVIYHFLHIESIFLNQIATLFVSIIFGLMSWHMCEKHFIKYGNYISNILQNAITNFNKKIISHRGLGNLLEQDSNI